MSMMQSTDGRLFAVVTGASSGIGFELAKQFAHAGFNLLIAAEDAGIHTVVEGIGSPAKVETLQVDLSTPEGVEQLYGAFKGRPVDAIAINAGIGVGGDFVRETDLATELKLIDLNVRSVVHLSKLVLKDMVARNQGRVLITSSIASTMPGPFEAVYAASKAFERSFAGALRNEVKDTGVTITTLMPGPTETNFFHRAGMDDTKVGQSKKDDPADVAKDGFDALMNGRDEVYGGSFKNAVQGAMAHILPEGVKAEMHRKQAEKVDA